MLFFKETLSYKLVSLLDEAKVKRKYINIILFIITFCKFRISKRMQLKRDIPNKERINLFIEFFKERFYLEQLVRTNYTKSSSKVNYTLNNDIILCEISYDDIRFNVEYTLSDNSYCIYITARNRSFNVTEDNLNIEVIFKIFDMSLNMLRIEIIDIINRLFNKYWREVF